ncbi:polyprenyl synthetase family protein [Streptomyces sp. NPDC050759]|uniref:polyprenyl synthetase family protein n=1 Tax=Streptomyces sp. NPDC050759 TaxID=3365635 RepID=UPI0037A8931F
MTSATRPDTREAWELLRRAREVTGPELRRVVGGLPEPVRKVAQYHFGWRDASGNPAPGDWGKGVRGALTLASAQACGGGTEEAIRAAVCVELVHNFSLLHDDLMDNDRLRRGRPTAWALFGDARAVLAGDALLATALNVLIAEQPSSMAAVRELSETLLGLMAGQGADLASEARDDVAPEDWLRMAAGKTASLFAGACAMGALAVDARPDQVAGARAFGHHVGQAFQLTDDLLAIWGDSDISGKPVGGDLQRRKQSFPVVAALMSGTAASRELAELVGGGAPLSPAEIHRATVLMAEAGGRELTRREAARHRILALGQLTSLAPEPEGRRILESIAHLATHRER